jgi:hypothetical protein
MRSLQRKGHHPIRLAGSFALTLAVLTLACQDSKMATSPTGTSSPASAQVAGSWTGSFQAYDSRCGTSAASVTFQQSGTMLTGTIKTSDCGIGGSFRGAVDGTSILGWIDMTGCTGGGVSGTIEGGRITLSIADLTKPLVTGDQVIMAGGAVNLHR